MNKKLVAIAMALCFAVGSASAAFAKDVECTVTAVSGNTVTLDCKGAGDLTTGSTVKVKAGSASKKKAIEGC